MGFTYQRRGKSTFGHSLGKVEEGFKLKLPGEGHFFARVRKRCLERNCMSAEHLKSCTKELQLLLPVTVQLQLLCFIGGLHASIYSMGNKKELETCTSARYDLTGIADM